MIVDFSRDLEVSIFLVEDGTAIRFWINQDLEMDWIHTVSILLTAVCGVGLLLQCLIYWVLDYLPFGHGDPVNDIRTFILVVPLLFGLSLMSEEKTVAYGVGLLSMIILPVVIKRIIM